MTHERDWAQGFAFGKYSINASSFDDDDDDDDVDDEDKDNDNDC